MASCCRGRPAPPVTASRQLHPPPQPGQTQGPSPRSQLHPEAQAAPRPLTASAVEVRAVLPTPVTASGGPARGGPPPPPPTPLAGVPGRGPFCPRSSSLLCLLRGAPLSPHLCWASASFPRVASGMPAGCPRTRGAREEPLAPPGPSAPLSPSPAPGSRWLRCSRSPGLQPPPRPGPCTLTQPAPRLHACTPTLTPGRRRASCPGRADPQFLGAGSQWACALPRGSLCAGTRVGR